ncbi:aminoglycoside phosphotransferase family protein [Paenibacillus sp. P26]|nr:aminoglycoside phosphotransferase family protein [Paenibacillus sp. P26]UUZ93694.1 aminoglycoside phosphotransferase family protein [Paenibacillus sp. P25]
MRQVFGSGYSIARVDRMHGGAQKVVYKVVSTNHFTCVLYVWDLSMNYFQQEIEDKEPGESSYSGELFELNNKFLTKRGIRTPAVYDMNRVRDRHPFDFALVEYVSGRPVEDYFQSDPETQEQVLIPLGHMIAAMHASHSETFGKLNSGGRRRGDCHKLILENAIKRLQYLSQHLSDVAAKQDKVLLTLEDLASAIKPRGHYGFIHGELGPDHVLVNEKLEPYLIDIEGAEFFDIEHEYSFLEFRFGNHYKYLKDGGLDRDRMLFYKLHHHISCASGGLKLLHRGFPDKCLARQIVEYNTQSVIHFIQGQGAECSRE